MDFYTVDPDYMEYLQNFETAKRGFSRVPDIRYKDRNKFTFGAVLDIGDFHYYVTLSSFNKSQEANILIRIPTDKQVIKGSLRFNYMVPIPDSCLTRLVINDIADAGYKRLVYKEYRFCMNNADRIQKKARKIYDMVTENRKQILTDNSCSFSILEEACRKYIKNLEHSDKQPGHSDPDSSSII